MRAAALPSSLLALALTACAPAAVAPLSAPPLRPAPLPSPPPSAVAAPAPAAPAEPTVSLPPWIAGPAEPACAWLTQRWRRTSTITELRLRPGGPAFARITGGRAQLQIPIGKPEDGFLDVASSGLALEGIVDRAHVTFFAATEFPMNGVVYPTSSTLLSYVQGFAGGVSVTMDTPYGVTVSKPPLLARRSCADVSLDGPAALDPARAALGASNGQVSIVHGKRPLVVFSDPGRPSEVSVAVEDGSLVDSFASRGAFTRVGIAIDSAFVAGWVSSARLEPMSAGGYGRSGRGVGGIGFVDPVLKPIMKRSCPADVPLIAEAGDDRMTVGFVLAHTPMDIVEKRDPFFRVMIPNRDIHPSLKGVFLVRASDLEGCQDI